MKIGIGYDVHRWDPDRELILGGVNIPFEMGLLGHSDADVLVHAIMDAILGALGEKDIGVHFPDSDPEYQGISSLILLEKVRDLMDEAGYEIGNIDAVVIAQQPKLAVYFPRMKENISIALHCSEKDINLKATTEEGLGFTGRMEGMAAQAVCLLNEVK